MWEQIRVCAPLRGDSISPQSPAHHFYPNPVAAAWSFPAWQSLGDHPKATQLFFPVRYAQRAAGNRVKTKTGKKLEKTAIYRNFAMC